MTECYCTNVGAVDNDWYNSVKRWATCWGCGGNLTTLSADFADLFFAGNTYHIPNSDYIALTASQQQELDDQSNVIIDVPMGECDLETGCGGHCEGDDWYFTSCQMVDGVPTCGPDTDPDLNSSNCMDHSGDGTGTPDTPDTPDTPGTSTPVTGAAGAMGLLGLIVLAYLLLKRKHK